jgi:hypothetical protein
MPDKNMYLGDGLYVSFDGYQIVLKANSETNPTDKVYLDPSVFRNFLIYAKSIGWIKE